MQIIKLPRFPLPRKFSAQRRYWVWNMFRHYLSEWIDIDIDKDIDIDNRLSRHYLSDSPKMNNISSLCRITCRSPQILSVRGRCPGHGQMFNAKSNKNENSATILLISDFYNHIMLEMRFHTIGVQQFEMFQWFRRCHFILLMHFGVYCTSKCSPLKFAILALLAACAATIYCQSSQSEEHRHNHCQRQCIHLHNVLKNIFKNDKYLDLIPGG